MSDRQRIRYKNYTTRSGRQRGKLVLEDRKSGWDGLLDSFIVLALLAAGVIGYQNRCKWFHICGNTAQQQQPQQTSKPKTTTTSKKNTSKKKKHSTNSNYTDYHTIDLANGSRYNNLGRIAI